MKKGIDISQWQGKIDFAKVAKEIDFVILREGYRMTLDPYFLEYASGAMKNGIKVHGVYHFIYALDSAAAKKEALNAIANVKKAGLPKTTPIWADMEGDSVEKAAKAGVNLGKAEINLFTRTFCDTIIANGYPTGIYANIDWYKNKYTADTLAKYPIWLADYSGGPDHECVLQQYTSSGKVSGISGNVDMDYCWCLDCENTKSPVETAIRFMEELAKDDSHGYDQRYRWGEKGDYDCSSAVFTAWQQAGVRVKDYSFSKYGVAYTGSMYETFLANGFEDVTKSVNMSTGAGMQRGDVLLNKKKHTAMFCGNGKEVEASINEKGTASGGTPGDQTGKEFLIRSYRNYPWDCVLRYKEEVKVVETAPSLTPIGKIVKDAQTHIKNFTGIKITETGIVKAEDYAALRKALQTALNLDLNAGLAIDGEIGPKSTAALRKVALKKGARGYLVTVLEMGMMLDCIDPSGLENPGIFGTGLDSAVKKFQKKHGLAQDGVAGINTLKAMVKA